MTPSGFAPIWSSVVHLATAMLVYWHLISGGWLTERYRLNDPNIVNLVLAIFEPIAVISVAVYWIARKPALRRFMVVLAYVQIAIGVGFLVFFIVFASTFRFKLM